jgi:hypothetical protein
VYVCTHPSHLYQHLDLSRNLLAKNIEQIQQWPEALCSLNLSGNRFGADAVRLPAFPPRLQARHWPNLIVKYFNGNIFMFGLLIYSFSSSRFFFSSLRDLWVSHFTRPLVSCDVTASSDSRPEHEWHWRRHLVHARPARRARGIVHVQQSARRTRARALPAARYVCARVHLLDHQLNAFATTRASSSNTQTYHADQ